VDKFIDLMPPRTEGDYMSNVYRSIAWLIIAIVVAVILMVFIGFFLKLAVLFALLAFAYYWYTRAVATRRGRRPW
jgi:cobalamin synthase